MEVGDTGGNEFVRLLAKDFEQTNESKDVLDPGFVASCDIHKLHTVDGKNEGKQVMGFRASLNDFDHEIDSELASDCGDGTEEDASSDLSGKRMMSKLVQSNGHKLETRDSADELIFGDKDFDDFLHENQASLDAFSDALDGPIDADGSQSTDNMQYHDDINNWLNQKQNHELKHSEELLSYLECSEVIKGTGRPDLFDDEDETGAPLNSFARCSLSSDECYHSPCYDARSRLSSRQSFEYDKQEQKEYDVELDSESSRIRYVCPTPIPIRTIPETIPSHFSVATDGDAIPLETSGNIGAIASERSEGVQSCSQTVVDNEPTSKTSENQDSQGREEGNQSDEGQNVKILTPGFQRSDSLGLGVANEAPLAIASHLENRGDLGHEFAIYENDKLASRSGLARESDDRDLTVEKECSVHLTSGEWEKSSQVGVSSPMSSPLLHATGVHSSFLGNERTEGIGWGEDLGPDELSRYVEALELKESYVDTVLDMEDVLLNFDDNDGPFFHKLPKGVSMVPSQHVPGNLSAKSSVDNDNPKFLNSSKVDSIEITGARQRSGGASLSERVVGVKEHTVYIIKVRTASKEWEVERRYRDFVDLYRQLKKTFVSQMGLSLPAPWGKVDLESRKFIGITSPDVIELRSNLLQVCLQSLLDSGPPLSTATSLLQFLCSPNTRNQTLDRLPNTSPVKIEKEHGGHQLQLKELKSSPVTETALEHERTSAEAAEHDVFGKTIRLIVKIPMIKPLKQQMAVQHHTCAGCYGQLDSAAGFVSGIASTLGLSGPRLCDYSGQLFCVKCHLNEAAVIPARVLHMWDFTPRRVSQLAKAYLDSIYDQPMLCVSAVNPFLYSRVPILAYIREMRRKLSKMFYCICCASRSTFHQMVGSRRHLLEDNDFFALHDLEDLSKGAFSVLPGLLEMISEKVFVHVSDKCTVCQEVAEPCAAGLFCSYPSSLIFPFDEQKVHRCLTCHSASHEDCIKKCGSCRVCNLDQLPSVTAEECSTYHPKSKPSSSSREDDHDSQSSYGVDSNNTNCVLEERHSKPNKYLARLFGSRESQQERQRRLRTSKILNMTQILGPPEL